MKIVCVVLLAFASAFTFTGCTTSTAMQRLEESEPAEPDQTVEQAAIKFLSARAVTAPIKAIATESETEHKFSTGKIKTRVDAVYKKSASGLTISIERTLFGVNSNKTAAIGEAITACGFGVVMGKSTSTSDSTMTTMVPAGGVFIPLPISSRTERASLFKTTNLSYEGTLPCDPEPGKTFSMLSARKLVMKSQGMFGSILPGANVNGQSVLRCDVALQEQSAQTIHPKLRGMYRSVKCRSGTEDNPTAADYAFLIDSKHYISLGSMNKYGPTVSRVIAVEYE